MNSPSSAVAPSLQGGPHEALQAPLWRKGTGVRPSRRAPLALLGALLVLVGLAFGAGPASAAAPIFTVDPTPTVSYTSAQVSGTIDPGETEVFYAFQHTAHPETEGWVFGSTLVAGSGPNNVSEELAGLKPGTKYQLRLWALATDFSQEWTSPEPYVSFETKPVTAPTTTIDPITTHTSSTAHISGTVDPSAPAGPLDAATKAVYRTEWHFECTPECPGLAGGAVEGEEGSQSVSVNATGLEPNTAYEVRLVAENAGGPTTASESFATDLIPASVKTATGGSDGKGGYVLQGVVNPHNSGVTACSFKYGTTTAYGKEAACSPMPGAGGKSVEVTAHLSGLTPGASYHFELTATNGDGTTTGGDVSFTAPAASGENCPNDAIRAENASTALPECRAYELVTATFKEGFSATLGYAFSEDGTVEYLSLAGNIGNAGSGSSAFVSPYVATRTNTGWETPSLNGQSESIYAGPEGITPPSLGEFPSAFSEDLRSSIWFFGKSGESNNAQDIYIREPGAGFSLVAPLYGHPVPGEGVDPLPPGPPGHNPLGTNGLSWNLSAMSADLSHLVFKGDSEITDLWGPGLYEFVGIGNTAPRRVDVDNSGSSISPCGTQTGPEEGAFISPDGEVIVFTELGCTGGPAANEVWARVGGSKSYDASASLCTRKAGEPGGTCNAAANAEPVGTSQDGSHIYLTTTQQLLNGDTNETKDLYEYTLPTASDPNPSLVEVSAASGEANVEGAVNVSEDGSTVYFVATGVLAANADALGGRAVSGQHNLYVWRQDPTHPQGQTKFVALLDQSDSSLWCPSGQNRGCRLTSQSTADGHYLVMNVATPLLATDTDNARDVYRYDAETGEMLRTSTGVTGTGGNAEGFDAEIGAPVVVYSHRRRSAMSNDGEKVVFTTNEALSPADTNGQLDVYLWHSGHVSLISDGHYSRGTRPGIPAYIDGSGQDIYFATPEALTPNDGDTSNDVYDARVDGGFSLAISAPCSGEACQSSLSAPLAAAGAAASATLSGSGNLPAPAVTQPKPLTRAQKLAKALRSCKKQKARQKRTKCEARARKRYRTTAKAKPKAKSPKGGR